MRLAALLVIVISVGCPGRSPPLDGGVAQGEGEGDLEPPGCFWGRGRCDGTCIDVSNDALHCGGCGRACADGQTCSAGLCVAPCAADRWFPSGSFPLTNANAGPTFNTFYTSGDVDGDGDADLVSTNLSHVGTHLNEGGQLGVRRPSPRGSEDAAAALFERLTTTDLDGDSALDLVVGCEWLRGAGDGTFSSASIFCSGAAEGLGAGDVDEDGVGSVLWRDPAGTWIASATDLGSGILLEPPGEGGGGIDDFNDDGILDVATVTATELHVRYGAAGAPIESAAVATSAIQPTPTFGFVWVHALRLADGAVGVLVRKGSGPIAVYESDGAGGFSLRESLSAVGNFGGVADADGDGDDDILMVRGSPFLVEQTAAGFIERGFGGLLDAQAGALLDVNGDGAQDVAVVSGLNVYTLMNGAAGLGPPIDRWPVPGPTEFLPAAFRFSEAEPPIFIAPFRAGDPGVRLMRGGVTLDTVGVNADVQLGDVVALDVDGVLPSEIYAATQDGLQQLPVLPAAPFIGPPVLLLPVGTGTLTRVNVDGVAGDELLTIAAGVLTVIHMDTVDAFTVQSSSPTAASRILGSADVDGDGDQDLVARGPTMLLLENTPAGFLDRTLEVPDTAVRVVAADIDADGDEEILARTAIIDRLADGSFEVRPHGLLLGSMVLTDTTPGAIRGIATLFPDVAAAFELTAAGLSFASGTRTLNGSRIERLQGDLFGDAEALRLFGENGVFGPWPTNAEGPPFQALLSVHMPHYGTSVTVDFDGDREPEIVSLETRIPSTGLALWRRDPDGDYQIQATAPLSGREHVSVIDVNGDGAEELAALRTADGATHATVEHLVEGALEVVAESGPSAGHAVDLKVADVDRDGIEDVLALLGDDSRRGDTVIWWRATVPLGFGPPVIVTLPSLASDLLATDLDGDGRTDVLALGDEGVVATFNFAVSPQAFVPLGRAGLFPFQDAQAVDIDGDGAVEIVVAVSDSAVGALFVLRFTGAGFDVQDAGAIDGGGSITPGDFDGDGDVDFLVGGSILFENTEGVLRAREAIRRFNASVADLDHDGHLDLVGGSVLILPSNCAP